MRLPTRDVAQLVGLLEVDVREVERVLNALLRTPGARGAFAVRSGGGWIARVGNGGRFGDEMILGAARALWDSPAAFALFGGDEGVLELRRIPTDATTEIRAGGKTRVENPGAVIGVVLADHNHLEAARTEVARAAGRISELLQEVAERASLLASLDRIRSGDGPPGPPLAPA